MRKREEISLEAMKELSTRFNQMKSAMIMRFDNKFNITTLTKYLKQFGFKSVSVMIEGLKYEKIIVKSGNSYTFSSKEPVFMEVIKQAILYGRNKKNLYNANWKKHKSEQSEVIEDVEPEICHELTEREAISFLKGLGYKILKPEYIEI